MQSAANFYIRYSGCYWSKSSTAIREAALSGRIFQLRMFLNSRLVMASGTSRNHCIGISVSEPLYWNFYNGTSTSEPLYWNFYIGTSISEPYIGTIVLEPLYWNFYIRTIVSEHLYLLLNVSGQPAGFRRFGHEGGRTDCRSGFGFQCTYRATLSPDFVNMRLGKHF